MISVFYSSSLYSKAEHRLHRIASYKHQNLMVGGCNTASLTFSSDHLFAEDWVWNGLGRMIEVFSQNGVMVWQGIVNNITINLMDRAVVVGPYMNISNNVVVAYAEMDWAGLNNTAGQYLETAWNSDSESIDKYGMLEEVVSGGQGLESEMEVLRDRSLAKKKDPQISEGTTTTPGTVNVALECVGLHRLMEKQVYNKAYYDDGLYYLNLKIDDILDDNYNFAIGSENHINIIRDIHEVAEDVNVKEDKNRMGWQIIKDHVTKSSLDLVVGVFPDRKFILHDITETNDNKPDTAYYRTPGSGRIKLGHSSDQYVEESEIMPGRYMELTDFNRPVRYLIESVDYDLQKNKSSTNQFTRSLRKIVSAMMLGES